MCRLQSVFVRALVLFLVGGLAVGCDRGAPAQKQKPSAPPAGSDAAATAIRDPAVCRDAIAAWTTLPEIPEAERKETHRVDLQPSVEHALGVLGDAEAFTQCSDEQLAPMLALSMTRFENLDAISDSRGAHGARIDVRFGATRILSNLSGQPFGTLSVEGFDLDESPCDYAPGHDDTVLTKWRAWWEHAQKDPLAVVAAARAGKAVPFVFEGELGARLAVADKQREIYLRDCDKRPRGKLKIPKECMENPLAKGCS